MFISFNVDPSLMPFEMRRRAWQHAREEARNAYRAWTEAQEADRAAAFALYRAAEEREAAAAKVFGVS
jgi:Spy/CpxP family protein refolding chaperone